MLALFVPAAVKLILHLAAAGGYGLHGDELYYLACSDHLDWGYVDHPPLSIGLLHVERVLFGDGMLSLRLLPGLAGSLTVLLTGLIARRAGASPFGQFIAGLCALVAPAYLAVDHYFSMNAFDVLFWTVAVYIVLRIIDGGPSPLWAWLGVVVGLAFENKLSILFLCFGLAVGFLLSKERRLLRTPWILVGAGIALLLMLPNVVWQSAHDWPTREWMANARSGKMISLSLPAYLREQVFLMQPLTVLVWGTGLVAVFFRPSLARYRLIGWCYLSVLALFVVLGGKPYYLIPVYPALIAAGAVVIDGSLEKRWLRAAAIAVLLAAGAATAPLGIPLLPVDGFIAYSDALGMHPSSGERSAEGKLPSFFASMFGWEKLASVVDTVYRSLPADDRARCGIFCQNYMEAGAIDFYGRRMGLPRAICGHNSYWLWGPGGSSGEVMIVVGVDAGVLRKYYVDVAEVARFRDEYVQPMHDNMSVVVVRGPKLPLSSMWAAVKMFI